MAGIDPLRVCSIVLVLSETVLVLVIERTFFRHGAILFLLHEHEHEHEERPEPQS